MGEAKADAALLYGAYGYAGLPYAGYSAYGAYPYAYGAYPYAYGAYYGKRSSPALYPSWGRSQITKLDVAISETTRGCFTSWEVHQLLHQVRQGGHHQEHLQGEDLGSGDGSGIRTLEVVFYLFSIPWTCSSPP